MSNKRALNLPLEGTLVGAAWTGTLATTWVDLTGASFSSLDGGTLATSNVFVTLSVKNRSSSTNLFLLLKAGAGATSAAHLLEGGDTFTYSALHGFNGATGVKTISLQPGGTGSKGYVAYATFLGA